ncbi:hypothetical protein D3C72_1017580 [compost metagenome]
MQARIFRAQLATRTALHHLLHGPQGHVSSLRGNHAFCLREALIKHRTVFSNHRAHRRELRTVTAAGDGLEGLRHFDRRQVQRPQNHRWHRMQLIFWHTQFLPGVGNRRQTQRHTEVNRRDVHRTRQSIHQHHLAAELFIVVLRRPYLAIRLTQRNRRIGNPGIESILIRLAQSSQIGRRFCQRTNRTTRLHRTVVARKLRLCPANHRAHFSAITIDDDHCGFQIAQLALLFQHRNAVNGSFLSGVLRHGVKGGKDLHAGEIFHFVAEFGLQLLTHHLHKCRLWRDHATARLHAQRTRAQHVVQLLIDHLLLLQQAQNQVTTLQRQFRVAPRVID